MAEERSANEVVVESRDRLAGVDVSKGLERGLVARVEKEGFANVELESKGSGAETLDGTNGLGHLRNKVVLGISLAVVVDDDAAHADVRDDGRVLLL